MFIGVCIGNLMICIVCAVLFGFACNLVLTMSWDLLWWVVWYVMLRICCSCWLCVLYNTLVDCVYCWYLLFYLTYFGFVLLRLCLVWLLIWYMYYLYLIVVDPYIIHCLLVLLFTGSLILWWFYLFKSFDVDLIYILLGSFVNVCLD